MTEAESTRQRCCGPIDCGNKGQDGLRYCMGSPCQGWRWQTDGWVLDFDGVHPILRRPDGDPPHGFCGLAGKP